MPHPWTLGAHQEGASLCGSVSVPTSYGNVCRSRCLCQSRHDVVRLPRAIHEAIGGTPGFASMESIFATRKRSAGFHARLPTTGFRCAQVCLVHIHHSVKQAYRYSGVSPSSPTRFLKQRRWMISAYGRTCRKHTASCSIFASCRVALSSPGLGFEELHERTLS